METRICGSCKRMFHYIAGPVICPQCRIKEEEKFQIVKAYLRENPGASLAEISEETGVSSKLILRFLREERLEVAADSAITLVCERCGKKISTGIRCSQCEAELLKTLNQIKGSFIKENEEEVESRLRFLDASQLRR